MPGYSCSVKERMLYSSCKAPLLDACESVLKMEIVKKVCLYVHILLERSVLTTGCPKNYSRLTKNQALAFRSIF